MSTESLSPQTEGGFALVAGLAIGFVACWQMALICLALSPVMAVGNALAMKLQTGLVEEQNDSQREANLLCGDAIANFKTVQSLGNTELIVQKYEELLKPSNDTAVLYQIKTGFAFGLSQCAQYMVFAAMFFFGGKLINDGIDPVTGEMSINPQDVFVALFAIMFGATHMGSASAMGPDIGKAGGAAKRVFGILESPTQIDAIAIDAQPEKKRIDFKGCKGKIEFRNVWFRYPTRKEDFVHRGLNLTINPGESVALVGESGCGKSTFVNLMMRFYDVDSGAIYLDDDNIKDLNLHDLRRAVSLVMQEPIIFNYSILENILYGDLNASNEQVHKAAELANVLDFVESSQMFEVEETA